VPIKIKYGYGMIYLMGTLSLCPSYIINLENLNAHLINDGMTQSERLVKLNQIAIHQIKLLTKERGVKMIGEKK